MSPHPRQLVSPYPQYTNTGNITRGANVYHPEYVDTGKRAYGANIIRPQYVNTGNSAHIANPNESIEEIFDYIKQKSFDSSREDSHINVSNVCENDQNDGYGVSKDASVGTGDDSDSNSEDVETIECSFSAETAPNHDTNIGNRNDKIVSSTVYSDYDEVDACDTGYGASNIKDTDFSALTDAEEQIRYKTEPPHEKTNVLVSDLVRHKPGCTVTEDG